jgi:sulfite reductase alpha subunit-like flavoprotein
MLIFGCRSRCDDYLYEEEISAAKKAKVLTHVHTAFSRDDPWKKVYVQNRIDERSRKILELLDAGAHFYVCGGALMAKDVRKVGFSDDLAEQQIVEVVL